MVLAASHVTAALFASMFLKFSTGVALAPRLLTVCRTEITCKKTPRRIHGRRDTDQATDDAGIDWPDFERHGAHRPGCIPVAYVLHSERVRRATRGAGHVVRHSRRRRALSGNRHRVRRALEALSRSGLVVFLRGAGVPVEIALQEVRAHRE